MLDYLLVAEVGVERTYLVNVREYLQTFQEESDQSQ